MGDVATKPADTGIPQDILDAVRVLVADKMPTYELLEETSVILMVVMLALLGNMTSGDAVYLGMGAGKDDAVKMGLDPERVQAVLSQVKTLGRDRRSKSAMVCMLGSL